MLVKVRGCCSGGVDVVVLEGHTQGEPNLRENPVGHGTA